MLLTALVVFSVLAQNCASIDMPGSVRGTYLVKLMGQGLPHFFPRDDFLAFIHSEVELFTSQVCCQVTSRVATAVQLAFYLSNAMG